uniref:Uncharacterized protein n=1 Tax=Pseudogyrinocheilus prochilus TaxID=400002 RepID=A0A2L0A430_9TELE|nr:hypothetical protein [Pseudogyrinocheilus prochilus]
MDRAIDDFKKKMYKSGLKETSSHDGCHFFLFFCPIISRAGTDIDNALKYLDQVKAPKRIIMVVLHPTIDPEKTILDSNSAITREDIFAVDCLFSDNELLTCEKNTNAINKIAQDLKSKKQNEYYCLKKDHGNPCLVTDQEAENRPLMSNEPSMHQPNTTEDGRSEELSWLCLCIKWLCCCCNRSK